MMKQVQRNRFRSLRCSRVVLFRSFLGHPAMTFEQSSAEQKPDAHFFTVPVHQIFAVFFELVRVSGDSVRRFRAPEVTLKPLSITLFFNRHHE